MFGWHHSFSGHELGQTLGDGEGQGGLVWCGSRGRKESNMIEQLNNNSNNNTATHAQDNPFQGWVPLIGVPCLVQAQAKPFSGCLQPCCLGACRPPAARESRCPARPWDHQVLACPGFLSSLLPAATPVPSCKPLLLLPWVLSEPSPFTRQFSPRSGQPPPSPSALQPACPHRSP